jgi:hypothetical protein
MGLWKSLFGGSEKINDYFSDAVYVYIRTADPVVRMATLAAAKVAAGAQRASMVNYLRVAAAEVRQQESNDDASYRLNQLADEISLHGWTVQDAVHERQALAKLDKEYTRALDRFDSTIFRRRFVSLFPESE